MKKLSFILVLIVILTGFTACKKNDSLADVRIGSITVNPQTIEEKESAIITISIINLNKEPTMIESIPTSGVTNPSRTETNGGNVSITYTAGTLPDDYDQQTVLVKIIVKNLDGEMLDSSEVSIIVEES